MIAFLRNLLKKTLKNQLIAGSAVLFIGNTVASFGNYLYHLLMGRMLGPADYGVLASLISLTYLLSIPIGALNLVVVKYVSEWREGKNIGAISYFYFWINKKIIVFGLALLILLIIFSPKIAFFLHFESVLPLTLMIVASLVGIFATVNTAILQGFLRFGLMSILGVVNVILKLVIAVLLVYWGWRVFGAVLAILITSLTSCSLVAFFALRLLEGPKAEEKRETINTQEIIKYAFPVFFSTLAFTSLFTTDIILARHFLPSGEAGFYSALATLGKIIFFASSPIIMVMFPMVSGRHTNGKKCLSLFNLSLGLVTFICVSISLIYVILPELMIKILFGSQYLAASPHLFLFAVFLSLYSISSLLVNFHLSIKQTQVVIFPSLAALAQIIMISIFHQSIAEVALVSVTLLSLLTVSLLVYFFLGYVKDKKACAFSHRSCL